MDTLSWNLTVISSTNVTIAKEATQRYWLIRNIAIASLLVALLSLIVARGVAPADQKRPRGLIELILRLILSFILAASPID